MKKNRTALRRLCSFRVRYSGWTEREAQAASDTNTWATRLGKEEDPFPEVDVDTNTAGNQKHVVRVTTKAHAASHQPVRRARASASPKCRTTLVTNT
jgi:hypothetical protein